MLDEHTNARDAAKTLFRMYKDELYQYARFTLGNPTEADDFVQDVFLKAMRTWDRFQHQSTSRTWLWSIARHTMKDKMRKIKRTGKRQDTAVIDELMDKRTESDTDAALTLEWAIRKLSVPYRQVIVLRLIQDKSSAEVAEILGWSDPKVRVTLHRATQQLRALLTDDKQWREGPSGEQQ